MEHENEYHDSMVRVLEWIWGEGFMAPGGEGNVEKLVDGIVLEGCRILDIGCGLGGPACLLAAQHGAYVVGTDLEAPLVERARRRADALGVSDRATFEVVTAGDLTFDDRSFDLVMSSGGLTQTPDKLHIFGECLRVLKPGGDFRCYDWMKNDGEYSKDMKYWFEMEGLTYAMETPDGQRSLLEHAGFDLVETVDGSAWYRRRAREEYEQLRDRDYARLIDLVGTADAEHFVENWRSMVVVCEKGEMLQVYSRARRPRDD
jgi:ubiquinone/menaquinone biosynthesis C-methylase UbiE